MVIDTLAFALYGSSSGDAATMTMSGKLGSPLGMLVANPPGGGVVAGVALAAGVGVGGADSTGTLSRRPITSSRFGAVDSQPFWPLNSIATQLKSILAPITRRVSPC